MSFEVRKTSWENILEGKNDRETKGVVGKEKSFHDMHSVGLDIWEWSLGRYHRSKNGMSVRYKSIDVTDLYTDLKPQMNEDIQKTVPISLPR